MSHISMVLFLAFLFYLTFFVFWFFLWWRVHLNVGIFGFADAESYMFMLVANEERDESTVNKYLSYSLPCADQSPHLLLINMEHFNDCTLF